MISIIVPVYRAEAYLEKCVQSIQTQEFSDFEIILVDDGSPDRCPEICDRLAVVDSRIRVIHQKNAGVAAARNAGLDAAQGEYVTFVDSDDTIEPQMYSEMMAKAREYDCDVVMCDCLKEFENRTELYTHDIRPGYYSREQLEKEYFPHLIMMPNVEYPPTISNCLCLFRHRHSQAHCSSLRYEVGIRYSEDLLFGAQLMYGAKSFYYMKGQAFYHYNCTNQQSATHRFVPNKWKDYLKLHTCLKEYFADCPEFDFQEQIDKALLFFVYNAVGECLSNKQTPLAKRVTDGKAILNAPQVREMMNRLNISHLSVPIKQKIITICYRYRVGIDLLAIWLERKG